MTDENRVYKGINEVVLSPFESVDDLGSNNLKIIQDSRLYKFTSDSVLLSKFATFKPGEVVADFCSGSGIVGLHYYSLHQDISEMVFYELQPSLAEINRKSLVLNGLEGFMRVENCRVQDIRVEQNGHFSLILCNPPYKKQSSGIKNLDEHIALCRHEIGITQEEICCTAFLKLRRGGRLCICQRADRLVELICDLEKNDLHPHRLQFVASGREKKVYLVMVEAIKAVHRDLIILNQLEN